MTEPASKKHKGNPTIELDSLQLLKAINFACQKHSTQRRKDAAKTPYINHPVGVAQILAAEGGITDVKVLMAAVLHDTVEDTNTTFEELQTEFGKEVMEIVKQCTDDKSLPKAERKRLQVVNAPHKTPEAKQVKMGDKLYNLRDLQSSRPEDWTLERMQEYFAWAKKVIQGCRGVNDALEAELDKIFEGTFTFEGKQYKCIVDEEAK